jgi:hypothetical protein
MAFKAVSNAPPIMPLRRMVPRIVAAAMTAPMTGTDLDSRRESRTPPHLTSRLPVIVMRYGAANPVPRGARS